MKKELNQQLIFGAILKIWKAESSSQIGLSFLPDVCQLSSRKNDVGSREFFRRKFFWENGRSG